MRRKGRGEKWKHNASHHRWAVMACEGLLAHWLRAARQWVDEE